MKYTDKNKPLVCMQTHSDCYKGTSKMDVKGVLWHSTGANNPTLKRYVQPYNKTSTGKEHSANTYSDAEWVKILGNNTNNNDWNHISRSAGLNCWVGKLADGTVTTVQTMPWDYKPWGCGASGLSYSCNSGWIQFEICEDNLTDRAYFTKAYMEACEITAYLCKMYNINPKGTVNFHGKTIPTILCHQDAYKLGVGGNHGDIYHWFPKHNKNMEDVRNDVAALMAGATFKLIPENLPADDPLYEELLQPIEPTAVKNLTLKSTTTTVAKTSLEVGENFSNYSWKYVLTNLRNNTKAADEAFTVTGIKKDISFDGLTPNTSYSLEIFAEDELNNFKKSPSVLFTTQQDFPANVKSVSLKVENFLQDSASCTIKINPTNSWGESNRSTKGYRTSLLINGQEVSFSDNFFSPSGSSSKTMSLASFLTALNVKELKITDTLQIGVQAWVKDEYGEFVFSEGYPCYSKPVYLQHYITPIDKVFLNTTDKNPERAVLHLTV